MAKPVHTRRTHSQRPQRERKKKIKILERLKPHHWKDPSFSRDVALAVAVELTKASPKSTSTSVCNLLAFGICWLPGLGGGVCLSSHMSRPSVIRLANVRELLTRRLVQICGSKQKKKEEKTWKKKRNREKEKTREKKAVWQILFIQALMDEGAFGYGAAWLGRRRLHCAEILMILQL